MRDPFRICGFDENLMFVVLSIVQFVPLVSHFLISDLGLKISADHEVLLISFN